MKGEAPKTVVLTYGQNRRGVVRAEALVFKAGLPNESNILKDTKVRAFPSKAHCDAPQMLHN